MIPKFTEPLLIGITGGIASGKSTVVKYLLKKGYPVIDADKLGHEVLDPTNPGYSEVVDLFGKKILRFNGTIDRKILGDIVFKDYDLLKKLNNISHPQIYKMIEKKYNYLLTENKSRVVFLEAALLIQANWHKLCDQVWLVKTKKSIALDRLQKRDNLSKKDALDRINSQDPWSKKLSCIDLILVNEGFQEELEGQIKIALQDH